MGLESDCDSLCLCDKRGTLAGRGANKRIVKMAWDKKESERNDVKGGR